MSWQSAAIFVLVAALVALCVFAIAAAIVWRSAGPEERALLKRIHRLSLRRKGALAVCLTREPRIPRRLRAIPPLLVLYLASPLDLIPDVIPVVGLVDDVLVGVVGIGLLVRFTPRAVLVDLVERQEAKQASKAKAARAASADAPATDAHSRATPDA
jgi:uncharacterized membrane protein YkvA (DUF1232 family)